TLSLVGCPILVLFLYLFFFFQAEDGIRDFHVTGVQTCALPIWPPLTVLVLRNPGLNVSQDKHSQRWPSSHAPRMAVSGTRTSSRSEERRVGKECRYRWGQDH